MIRSEFEIPTDIFYPFCIYPKKVLNILAGEGIVDATGGNDPSIVFYLDISGTDDEWRLLFVRDYSSGDHEYSSSYPGFPAASYVDGWDEWLFYSVNRNVLDSEDSTGFSDPNQGAVYYSPSGSSSIYVASNFSDTAYGDASFSFSDYPNGAGSTARGFFDGDPVLITAWPDPGSPSFNISSSVSIDGEYRLQRKSDEN